MKEVTRTLRLERKIDGALSVALDKTTAFLGVNDTDLAYAVGVKPATISWYRRNPPKRRAPYEALIRGLHKLGLPQDIGPELFAEYRHFQAWDSLHNNHSPDTVLEPSNTTVERLGACA